MVTGVLLAWAGLVLSQETLLAPLNKENIALSQVIFLPPGAPAGFSQPEGRSQHSSNEEEISSREDTMRSGLTDPAAPAEDQDHVMTGSYAYVRQVCCFNLINEIIPANSDLSPGTRMDQSRSKTLTVNPAAIRKV